MTGSESKSHSPKPRQSAEYDDDIAWYIQCAASALGERGTLGAAIAMVKRGSVASSGVPNSDLYSDRQVGWSENGPILGDIERARRLDRVWRRVPREHQHVLLVRYTTRSEWPPGVEAWLGPLCGVALLLAPDPAKLLKACENASKENHKAVIEGALKRAQRANQKAHEAWRKARREQYEAWANEEAELAEMRGDS